LTFCPQVILAACSPYFRAMFTGALSESSQTEVTIRQGTFSTHAHSKQSTYSFFFVLDLYLRVPALMCYWLCLSMTLRK